MLPTPSTSHLTFANIYEPSEDSFLLLDALSLPSLLTYHRARFPATSPSPLVLEVGTGSGVVLAFATAHATALFGRADVLALGVDVNRFACEGTVRTVQGAVAEAGEGAGALLDAVEGSLVGCVRRGVVDVLLFNPPYVPSEEVPAPPALRETARVRDGAGLERTGLTRHEIFERDSNCLALATDGGVDGMEITNRLLEQLPEVLSERGVAYVLLCAQNRPEEVKQSIRTWGEEWDVETVHQSGKQAGWEKLHIIRIARKVA